MNKTYISKHWKHVGTQFHREMLEVYNYFPLVRRVKAYAYTSIFSILSHLKTPCPTKLGYKNMWTVSCLLLFYESYREWRTTKWNFSSGSKLQGGNSEWNTLNNFVNCSRKNAWTHQDIIWCSQHSVKIRKTCTLQIR